MVRQDKLDPHTSEGGTLKPCPFCGGAATFLIQPEQQQRDNGDRVTCTGPLKCPGHRVYATVDDWNRRSAPAAGMVMVERGDLETLQLIADSAIKTRSRDVLDWMQDMERIKDKADGWLREAK